MYELDKKLLEATTKEEVTDLLKKGAYINVRDKDGRTPLMRACMRGNFEVAKALLENNDLEIDIVNEKDNRGWTPLMFACWRDDVETAKLLIDNKADVNAATKAFGFTVLMVASAYDSVKTIDLLYQNNAYVFTEDHKGKTAVDHAKNETTKDKLKKYLLEQIKAGYRKEVQRKQNEEAAFIDDVLSTKDGRE